MAPNRQQAIIWTNDIIAWCWFSTYGREVDSYSHLHLANVPLTNHTSWPAVVSSGMFVQWLILSDLVSCHKTVITTAKDKILNLLINYVMDNKN